MVVEKKGKMDGLTISYLGDGNNVCNSWLNACTMFSFNLKIGTSKETQPDQKILENAKMCFEYGKALAASYAIKHDVPFIVYERNQTYMWK